MINNDGSVLILWGFEGVFLLIMKKITSKNVKYFSFLPFGTSPSWK